MPKISIDKIKKIRNIRDDSIEIDDLKSSIKEHGLLQPIIVSRVNGEYHLVAGHRRYNACKDLGWSTIPAIIQDFKSPQLIQLVENMQRKNLSHLEEAESIHDLSVKLKVKKTRLANILGKGYQWIDQRLSLYDVRKHLLSTGILPTKLINSMSFQVAEIVAKHEQKYWLQMCAYLLGKRWARNKIIDYCESVVDPNYQPPSKTKYHGRTESRSITELSDERKESLQDAFSIIKDDNECFIKLMCTTERSYKYLLMHLTRIGGEII